MIHLYGYEIVVKLATWNIQEINNKTYRSDKGIRYEIDIAILSTKKKGRKSEELTNYVYLLRWINQKEQHRMYLL